METFAQYILNEQDYIKKMEIVYYLKKKTNIFYNKSTILKTELAKLFIETMNIDVDTNLIITACLLCTCKKKENLLTKEEIEIYAKESAEFLKTLGFSERFCKICLEQNRYTKSEPREKESDILELVDNFGGMLMHRPERRGFPIDEAIILLRERNLKNKNNRYIANFINFIEQMKEVKINDNSISYLEDLSNRINKADGINDCIEAIIQGREKLINSKEIKSENLSEKEQIPEDLVEQIRIKMMQSISHNENDNITKELEEALKQKIANGHSVSHVIINSDSYEIYENEENIKNRKDV